jgi:hypothetical protein
MSKRRAPRLILADEDAVRRVAAIIGPCSAADRALAERDMRRRGGERVSIFQAGSFWVVGPTPKQSEDADAGMVMKEMP